MIFTSAAILAMVVNPACGGVPVNDKLAVNLVATALEESGGDPLAIGINADPVRGLPGGHVTASSADEAVIRAAVLLAQGRDLDLGLTQINFRNLLRHHLTLKTVFDECSNLRAGAEHLADDHTWVLAHRRYNTGSVDRGVVYADHVMARIPTLPPPTALPPSSVPATEEEDLTDHPAGPPLYSGNDE